MQVHFFFIQIGMIYDGPACGFILFIDIALYLNRLSGSAACYKPIDFLIIFAIRCYKCIII